MESRELLAVSLIVFLIGMCAGLALAFTVMPDWPDRVYIPVEEPASPAEHREGMNT